MFKLINSSAGKLILIWNHLEILQLCIHSLPFLNLRKLTNLNELIVTWQFRNSYFLWSVNIYGRLWGEHFDKMISITRTQNLLRYIDKNDIENSWFRTKNLKINLIRELITIVHLICFLFLKYSSLFDFVWHDFELKSVRLKFCHAFHLNGITL